MTDSPNLQQAGKKLYISPKLFHYGDVRYLTQTGSFNQKENPAMVGSSYNKA
jgi:hypothetical protein